MDLMTMMAKSNTHGWRDGGNQKWFKVLEDIEGKNAHSKKAL
jgi:hypothetical protein